jgi:hypothetical protein
MQIENLIDINEICASHNIEISFISSLQKTGLIEIKTIDDVLFIDTGQVQQLEKCIHLHYDLDINIEGIETITYLLQRITTLQEEIGELRNRLRLYET